MSLIAHTVWKWSLPAAGGLSCLVLAGCLAQQADVKNQKLELQKSIRESKTELQKSISESKAEMKNEMDRIVRETRARLNEDISQIRERELATLRTLGFSMSRITVLISVENLAVALLGALAGIPPGVWLANYLLQISQTEGFSVYVTVLPRTLLIVIGSILALAFVGQGPGLRRVARLQLSEVIRLRDE